ncbi:4-hydroxy-tetrahydrodipicolinate synthase [Marinilabiliaceae bacterium JC017]|nr:4-hydroxy-tetrahydrodipicolinate synthase [Marinilabiliaceae bacterium JC017]
MAPEKLRGTGVALITPFTSDGQVDIKSLNKLVNDVITNQVDFLVALGTTAEAVTLSTEEKHLVMQTIITANNGRVPLVMGMGSNSTQQLVTAIKQHDFTGIDALLSVTPFYNKPNQEGLYLHFCQVAEASPLPVILYNVPGRTGTNLEADTTIQLAKNFKNIIAIKEASGDFIQIMDLIKKRPEGFLVLSGDDATTFPLVTLGGDGVISVIANAFPLEFSQMVHDVLNGNLMKSKAMHFRFTDIIKNLFIEGNPAGIKALLNIKGMVDNTLRSPLVPVSPETYLKLKEQMTVFYQ